MRKTSARGGPLAVALGIAAGFMVLAALWFGVVKHDWAMGAVFIALAASQLALLPATGSRRKGGGEGRE